MADAPKRRAKRGSDTQTPRRVSGAVDQAPASISGVAERDGYVVDSGIRAVKRKQDPNWVRTRLRARECRILLAGEAGLVMPGNFAFADADAFAADLPSTYTRPVELLALLLKKRCELERFRTTGSSRADDTATTLEQILTAVMEDPNPGKGYPWFQACDVVQNDALACVIAQPMATFWESEERPDWQDGETGTFKAEYQRDKNGRRRSQVEKGFRVNGPKSKAAYQSALDDWLANHVPILYRCFGPQEVTPIFGPNYSVDAVIVSGRYQRTSEMATQFLWGTDDHLSPAGTVLGTTTSTSAYGDVEILEYWGYRWNEAKQKREPYVSYSVDGMATTFRDGAEAVIDLSPYCSRLPVSVRWGQHWPGAPKLDQRALPFMWAFRQSIRQANAIATGAAVALWWAGFPTYTVDRSAAKVPINPNAQPRTLDIEPLKIIETDGPVTRLQGGDVSGDAWKLIQMLLGENEKAMQAAEAAPGASGASGFSQTVARGYTEDAQFMILEGIRRLYEDAASFTLEILTNIAREKGRPVPVYYAGPVVSEADSSKVTSTSVMLELTADMAGNVWRVNAEYPPSMSLPERQQSAELVSQRLKTRRKHFEDDGISDPERYAAEIEAEDLVNSPLGQAQRWDLIARILGDDQMAEKVKLIQQQQISQGPQGTGGLPFSIARGFEDMLQQHAMAEAAGAPGTVPQGGAGLPLPGQGGAVPPQGMPQGVQPGVPMGGQHMTGFGGPSATQASLGGIVAGAMQTGPINRSVAAGGAPPEGLGG